VHREGEKLGGKEGAVEEVYGGRGVVRRGKCNGGGVWSSI